MFLMERTAAIDRLLQEKKYDAFMIHDDSSSSRDLYYLSGFEASDPFTYLRTDGKSILVVSQLEFSRAREESRVDEVLKTSELSGEGNVFDNLAEEFGIEVLAVPGDFPLGMAEEMDTCVEAVESDVVMEDRKVKSRKEQQKLRKAQEATEKAMEKAEKLLKRADVRDRVLYLDGRPLTSERLRSLIKIHLIENGCEVPEETIVSSGRESAKPHATGEGLIKSGEPVVVDIFPRKDNYFGDMTRTFVKGNADEEVQDMKEAVLEAQKAAFQMLEREKEVKACDVHREVCEVLEEHGYSTLRDEDTEKGFIHSTGHAVGLDLHEKPVLAENEDVILPGMVLTIEPGLYLPETGGVRIEDMVLVTEEGYENFNSMSKDLELD